jgi:hypothetical protein
MKKQKIRTENEIDFCQLVQPMAMIAGLRDCSCTSLILQPTVD